MCIGYIQTLCHFVEGTSAYSNFGILGGHKTDLHRYHGMSELSYYAYCYLNLVSHSSRLLFFSLCHVPSAFQYLLSFTALVRKIKASEENVQRHFPFHLCTHQEQHLYTSNQWLHKLLVSHPSICVLDPFVSLDTEALFWHFFYFSYIFPFLVDHTHHYTSLFLQT